MRISRILGIAVITATTFALAACSPGNFADSETGHAAAGADGFPVTIEHAYGKTVIEQAPERVATVAWANHEVPLALGVVPVGMSKATWGDDDGDGVLPWVEDQLDKLGAETPVLFDETDGIDFDAVNETQPDVILAAYSGLTQEEYDRLSKIAPVVAYPDVAWGASYEDTIRLNSQALGLANEGDALIDELHATVEAALEKYPELKETKLLFSYLDASDLSQIGFYTSHDTRPGFFEGIGLPVASIVAEETEGTDAFYVSVSSEQADRFADVDVFVTYGDPDGDTVAQLQADPLLSKIPAIADGNIAILADSSPLAASANPSPLSIGWGIDEYFSVLADATHQAS